VQPHGTPKRGSLRQRIVDFVDRQPGVHKALVARQLGAGWTSVQHHVRGLAREGKIREVAFRGRSVLVPAALSPGAVVRAIYLGVPQNRKMLLRVVRAREARIQDLARQSGWPRKVVRRCLYALKEAQLVACSSDYHPRFRATASGRRAAAAMA
jgi:DNA-binding IclR family transcriptional regulator